MNHFQSGYAYADNNPISNIDFMGLDATSTIQDAWDQTPEDGSASFDGSGNCTCGCPGKPPCENGEEAKEVSVSSWFSNAFGFGKSLDKISNGDASGVDDFARVKSNWESVRDGLQLVKDVTLITVTSIYGVEYALIKVAGQGFKIIQVAKLAKIYGKSNAVSSGTRVGSAAVKSVDASDVSHFFSNIVDNYATSAYKYGLKGGDGVVRDLYQISGSSNGKSGIFEWIVEGAKVTHRRFIKGGKITGTPNQIVR